MDNNMFEEFLNGLGNKEGPEATDLFTQKELDAFADAMKAATEKYIEKLQDHMGNGNIDFKAYFMFVAWWGHALLQNK